LPHRNVRPTKIDNFMSFCSKSTLRVSATREESVYKVLMKKSGILSYRAGKQQFKNSIIAAQECPAYINENTYFI